MTIPFVGYTINPQSTQDDIESFLRTTYPHVPVIADGLIDHENDPDDPEKPQIEYFRDQSVKPFIILWFSTVKRRPRGRSMANHKLDAHYGSVDVVVVARDGTQARKLLNDVSDRLVDYRPENGSRLHKSASLWGSARSIDIQNRPTRFAMTDRFDFGVSSRKVTP